MSWELVVFGDATESEIPRLVPPSCVLRFLAGVVGARLGLRVCAQASKRKLHRNLLEERKRANGVSHAAIIVSTGFLDPAGAYAFGLRAPNVIPNVRDELLHRGGKHLIAILIPMPSSVLQSCCRSPTGLMFFRHSQKRHITKNNKSVW